MVEPIVVPEVITKNLDSNKKNDEILKKEEFDKIILDVKLKSQQKISFNDIKKFLDEQLLLPHSLIEQRRIMVKQLENALCKQNFFCKLQIYGSVESNLAFKDNSDIDIFVRVPNVRLDRQSLTKLSAENFEKIRKLFRKMRTIFKNYEDLFPHGVFVETLLDKKMRVPLLRLIIFNDVYTHNEFNEFYQLSIKCDVNVNCAIGCVNTRLIRLFCDYDSRFFCVVVLLKLWCKNILPETILLSSYAATLLVLFYFQQNSILPSVEFLIQKSRSQYPLYTNGCRTDFCTNLRVLQQNFPHKISDKKIFDLFIGFFEFYASFDFNSNYICTNSAKILSKNISSNIVEVYDPFDLKHNVTSRIECEEFVEQLIIQHEKNKNYLNDST